MFAIAANYNTSPHKESVALVGSGLLALGFLANGLLRLYERRGERRERALRTVSAELASGEKRLTATSLQEAADTKIEEGARSYVLSLAVLGAAKADPKDPALVSVAFVPSFRKMCNRMSGKERMRSLFVAAAGAVTACAGGVIAGMTAPVGLGVATVVGAAATGFGWVRATRSRRRRDNAQALAKDISKGRLSMPELEGLHFKPAPTPAVALTLGG